MCMIAATEAYTQNEEAETGRTCTVIFDAAKGSINLHYDSCNTWVHYKVVKAGSENGPRVKERMKESDDERYMQYPNIFRQQQCCRFFAQKFSIL